MNDQDKWFSQVKKSRKKSSEFQEKKSGSDHDEIGVQKTNIRAKYWNQGLKGFSSLHAQHWKKSISKSLKDFGCGDSLPLPETKKAHFQDQTQAWSSLPSPRMRQKTCWGHISFNITPIGAILESINIYSKISFQWYIIGTNPTVGSTIMPYIDIQITWRGGNQNPSMGMQSHGQIWKLPPSSLGDGGGWVVLWLWEFFQTTTPTTTTTP